MLIGIGVCATIASACSDSIQPGVMTATGGATGTGGSGTGATGTGATGTGATGTGNTGNTGGGSSTPGADDMCTQACCPTDAKCFSDATKAANSPGAACLATRDNVGQDHIQMRQTWINATAPVGNVGGIVYQVLSGRSELPMNGMNNTPNCNMGNGSLGAGGYIQLVDYFLKGTDHSQHFAVTGFAQFVGPGDVDTVLSDGLCMGTETFAGTPASGQKDYRLKPADMSLTTGYGGPAYPEGLPPPQALLDASGQSVPWKVGPTKAARVDADFDMADQTQRAQTLKDLEPTGKYGSKGFGGIFYYNDATGFSHAYSPLTYVIVYGADKTTHLTIPIREAEPKATFNDPAKPNCVGVYGTDPSLTIAGGCA
ncbi:MAG TPA: hypothetical protein VHU80_08840, partial [Polyangiaceae bacterium]|nr:hypothetical protein [Polyangiaceae bacterium]